MPACAVQHGGEGLGYLKYFGFSRKNYLDCSKNIAQYNSLSVLYLAKIAACMLFFLMAASVFLRFLAPMRWVYLISEGILLLLGMLYGFLKRYKINSITWAYLLMTMLFAFGIAVDIVAPDFNSIVFYVLLVNLPTHFIDNFSRMPAYLISISVAYGVLAYRYKEMLCFYNSIFKCVILLILSLLLYYHVCTKVLSRMLSDKKREEMLYSYRKVQLELQSKAQKDPLTGLYNRNAFIELATIYLHKDRRRSSGAVLGILDMDHFKKINDTYGHQTGDRVLVDVAQILEHALREGDITGRLGGDEFIFMLTDLTDETTAADVARRIIRGIEKMGDAKRLPLRATVGMVVSVGRDADFDELYQKADVAMYNAKQSGRNRFMFYSG